MLRLPESVREQVREQQPLERVVIRIDVGPGTDAQHKIRFEEDPASLL